MNARRIFVAIPISKKLQQEILNFQKKFQELPVRWIKPENLHITLVPPWYEENAQSIIGLLRGFGDKIASFSAAFNKVRYGPDVRRPRLIWAEGPVLPELIQLKSALDKALGQSSEKRPFQLHLTIARFRPELFSSFSIKNLDEKVAWTQSVESIVLMESRLSRAGAEYVNMIEVGLQSLSYVKQAKH